MPIVVEDPKLGSYEFPDDATDQEINQVFRHDELIAQREELNSAEPTPRSLFLSEFGNELSGNVEQAGIGITQGFANLSAGANKLLSLYARSRGMNPLAEQFEGASDVAQSASDNLETLGNETPGAELTRRVAGGVVQSLPSMAVAPAGLTAAAFTAAVQQFGSAQIQNEKFYQSEGASEDEARAKAMLPSLASAAITGLVTAGFGRTGIEALRNGVVTGGFRSMVNQLGKQAGFEGFEELTDEAGQIALETLALNRNVTPEQAVSRAITSFVAGSIAGGGVNALAAASPAPVVEPEQPQPTGLDEPAPSNVTPPPLPDTPALVPQPEAEPEHTWNLEVADNAPDAQSPSADVPTLEAEVDLVEEPLGINRAAIVDDTLGQLSDDALSDALKTSRKRVDGLEKAWDEVPAGSSLSTAQRRELGKAQDELTTLELEQFRRNRSDIHEEDLFREMLDLAERVSPNSPGTDQNAMLGNENFQKFQIIAKELHRRQPDMRSMLGPGKLSDDQGEVFKGRMEDARTLLQFVDFDAAPAIDEIEAPQVQASIEGHPVARVKSSEIAARPDLMQFKRMDDSESGENAEDQLEGEWDDLKAGNLLLWEPLDPEAHGLKKGERYVVSNGHHRLAFGKRAGTKSFNSQVVREADGVTALEARSLAAEINIADGKGTIYDQAKFFRNTAAAHGTDEALARGRQAGTRGRKAAAIGFSSTDNTFDAFINETISPDQAEAIAKAAPGNDALQRLGVSQAIKGKSPAEIANFIQAASVVSGPKAEQIDLFGADDSAIVAAEKMSAAAAAQQRSLDEQVRAVQGASKRPDLAAKLGVDVRDPDGLKNRIQELKTEREAWNSWAMNPELVAQVQQAAGLSSSAPAAPSNPALPKLGQMQNQGDLLGNQQEDFRLATESATDFDRVQREQAQREIDRAEADKQQASLFGQQPPSLTPKADQVMRDLFGGSALGIVPPGVAKIEEMKRASKLMDGERIRNEFKLSSVMPGRDWISSPEFMFRNDPLAKSIVSAVNEAELSYGAEIAHDLQRFDAIKQSLSEADQIKVTKALREYEAGRIEDFESLPLDLKTAALEIRVYFEQMRNLVINEKIQTIEDNLSPSELEAVKLLEAGTLTEAEVFADPDEFSELQKQTILASVDDLKAARKWGIANYVTHIERGHLTIQTPAGGVIARARGRVEAALKADAWLKANPDVESLTITDDFAPGIEFPTKLSKGQYFRFISRAAEELGTDADAIRQILADAGHVVAIKPTNKFAGAMQTRKDVLEGEENIFEALPAYTFSMRKKLALDPVFRAARSALPKLDKEASAQIEALLADVRGRKSLGDKIVDYFLSPQGRMGPVGKFFDNALLYWSPKPFGFSRGVNVARNITAKLKLGYRPVAVAVNRISGAMHTWVKTGTGSFLEGRKLLKTDEGKALLERNKKFIGLQAAFASDATVKDVESPWWAPMGLFQKMEQFNRPEAFAALYVHAQRKLKLEGEAAEKWAREATRFTQFTYNVASLPRIMRGPTGRLVLQFKPYLVKELEFISSLRGQEIPRYLVGALATGGPRAALYTLMSMPILGSFIGLDDLEDWLNRNYPRLSRGIPGILGVDVSPAVAFQFPQKLSDWAGPFLSDMHALWTGVLKPVLEGRERSMDDVQAWASRIAPIAYWWGEAIESASNEGGWTTDTYGRLDFKPTTADQVKMLLGAKPLEKSVQDVERRYLQQTEAIQREQRQQAIQAFLEALQAQDGAAIAQLSETLSEMGVTPDQIKRAAKQREIEPQERILRSLSRQRRAEEVERFRH